MSCAGSASQGSVAASTVLMRRPGTSHATPAPRWRRRARRREIATNRVARNARARPARAARNRRARGRRIARPRARGGRPRVPRRGARRRRDGSTSNHSVRSGCRPSCPHVSNCASTATSKPRPAPWYANVASVKRSHSTSAPRASAGSMTVRRWSRRPANTSSASVSASIGSLRNSVRSRSASGVPPGSRVSTTSAPRARAQSASAWMCEDLPAPSMPSNETKWPVISWRRGCTGSPPHYGR